MKQPKALPNNVRLRIAGKLLQTATLIRLLPRKNFDYSAFIRNLDLPKKGKSIHTCNTIGCVAGYYPIWYGAKCGLTYVGTGEDAKLVSMKNKIYLPITTALERFHEFKEMESMRVSLQKILFIGYLFDLNGKIILNDVSESEIASTMTPIQIARRFEKIAGLITAGELDHMLKPKRIKKK